MRREGGGGRIGAQRDAGSSRAMGAERCPLGKDAVSVIASLFFFILLHASVNTDTLTRTHRMVVFVAWRRVHNDK